MDYGRKMSGTYGVENWTFSFGFSFFLPPARMKTHSKKSSIVVVIWGRV